MLRFQFCNFNSVVECLKVNKIVIIEQRFVKDPRAAASNKLRYHVLYFGYRPQEHEYIIKMTMITLYRRKNVFYFFFIHRQKKFFKRTVAMDIVSESINFFFWRVGFEYILCLYPRSSEGPNRNNLINLEYHQKRLERANEGAWNSGISDPLDNTKLLEIFLLTIGDKKKDVFLGVKILHFQTRFAKFNHKKRIRIR